MVQYSNHHSNNGQKIVWYSDHHLNNRPFDYLTTFDCLNTRLVHDSDPHFISKIVSTTLIMFQDSNLEDKAHVLKIKDTLYSVVLGAVDIATGRNSYYKIQVNCLSCLKFK